MLPTLKRYPRILYKSLRYPNKGFEYSTIQILVQTMASTNYFDSCRKNVIYILKWKSVMEMHVITKSNNLHVKDKEVKNVNNFFVNV